MERESEEHKLLMGLCKRISSNIHNYCSSLPLFDEPGIRETDYSSLTVQIIIDKVKEFLKSENHTEIHDLLFLQYLANYPVSLCQRNISKRLATIISFNYFLSRKAINEQEKMEDIDPLSYEDLAIILCRSKSTIHEAISPNQSIESEIDKAYIEDKEARDIAKREMIEEEKRKLAAEQKKEKNEET